MDKSITAHEKEISAIITKNDPNTDWKSLVDYNKRHIDYFQAERLVHLIVTMCFALFAIISVFYALYSKIVGITVICILLLLMLIPYVFHYFNLENGVQSLYKLDKELQKKSNKDLFVA